MSSSVEPARFVDNKRGLARMRVLSLVGSQPLHLVPSVLGLAVGLRQCVVNVKCKRVFTVVRRCHGKYDAYGFYGK